MQPLVDGLALQVDVERDLVVQGVLGDGTYSVVRQGLYKGQPVALKLFSADVAAGIFIQELDILTRLRHPNTVSLLGVGCDDTHTYLILELCDTSLDK
jgi:serine/threonine protein kinase